MRHTLTLTPLHRKPDRLSLSPDFRQLAIRAATVTFCLCRCSSANPCDCRLVVEQTCGLLNENLLLSG